MTVDDLLAELRLAPLIASAQADDGTPLDHPESIVRLAQSSLREGVRVVRLQGVENIKAVRASSEAPIIGLIKRHYHGFEPYITPTMNEIEALLGTDCEVIGVDGTERSRPDASNLAQAIGRVHAAGRLALADCDTAKSVKFALECGADVISTTLAGYTRQAKKTPGPDLEFLRHARAIAPKPVLAEGRYGQRWQVEAALRIGAEGVVVGGALNDPVKQTKTLMPLAIPDGKVGAVDLGGTWLRFGVFTPGWKLERVEKVSTHATHEERAGWVRHQCKHFGVKRLGISSGGTIDPSNCTVIESKPTIPGHLGKSLKEFGRGIPVVALNDGLATAWGHACLPDFAGKRIATLAIGTGVGCGFVSEQRLWMGGLGEYAHLNDLPFGTKTIEDALGGASDPESNPKDALEAAIHSVLLIESLYFPDALVVCGGVGLSALFEPVIKRFKLARSPFGLDAGLYGAAALALFEGWR